jgi:hypothetical protein
LSLHPTPAASSDSPVSPGSSASPASSEPVPPASRQRPATSPSAPRSTAANAPLTAASQAATVPLPGPTAARSAGNGTPTATATTPTTVASSQPDRIAIPATGSWAYHLSGTRRIGAAGSDQPFNEDVSTEVTRVGGDSQTAVMRLYTSSNAGTEDDERSYGPGEVDWTSTKVSSAALSYGGNFSPPVPLIYWPPHIGASWSTSWTTGSTNGQTTTTLTGTRQVDVAGSAYTCYTTRSDSTFTGSLQGEQQTISCWVPELGMSAEDQTTEQGTYDGVSFYANTDAVLQAAP